jgi:hypothetical protein
MPELFRNLGAAWLNARSGGEWHGDPDEVDEASE